MSINLGSSSFPDPELAFLEYLFDRAVMSKSARKSALPAKTHGYEFQGP